MGKACDFGGLATITWPEDTPCRPSKSDETWCLAKRSVDPDTLIKDIGFVCSKIDCKMIGDGGTCLFPVDRHARLFSPSVGSDPQLSMRGETPKDSSGKSAGVFLARV